MRSIKLLHAADLHLDSPFDGLGADKAACRRAEQRKLLYRLAELAEKESVDMVLLAGDLLDSSSSYAETAEDISHALGSISVPVFISPGNHDFYSQRSPYARIAFPANVHIFNSMSIECVELPALGARVWGAAFCDKYSPGLLRGFRAEKKENVLDIMCLHGEVGGASQYCPITEDELEQCGMDYVALGHIHKESGLKRAGNTCYAWPGCPEGRGFDETGEKHVYIVTVSENVSIRQECIALRRYETLSVELKTDDALCDIRSALPEKTDSDIYRIILKGETEQPPQTDALYRALESEFFALQLRDETVIRRSVWESAGRDDLRGQFVMRLKSAFDAAKTPEEREKITQAVRWGLAALDGREEVLRIGD